MAAPPDPSWFDQPGWWQVLIGALTGVAGGFFAGTTRVMTLVSRVDRLETRAEATKENIERAFDAISALAESHRVAWEKVQQQIWDMRNEVAKLPTAAQLHQISGEIMTAIRESRFHD